LELRGVVRERGFGGFLEREETAKLELGRHVAVSSLKQGKVVVGWGEAFDVGTC